MVYHETFLMDYFILKIGHYIHFISIIKANSENF
jgi:hypothetical protein